MTAYADLLAMQHPEAEKLVIGAAQRWSGDEAYSFSTMELLARLDTAAAWDTMQKLMQNPNPAVRKRAYTMVAFWWPNDDRKLDPTTEDVAIQDLKADTFNNLDRRMILRALRRAPDTWVPAVAAALTNPERGARGSGAGRWESWETPAAPLFCLRRRPRIPMKTFARPAITLWQTWATPRVSSNCLRA